MAVQWWSQPIEVHPLPQRIGNIEDWGAPRTAINWTIPWEGAKVHLLGSRKNLYKMNKIGRIDPFKAFEW